MTAQLSTLVKPIFQFYVSNSTSSLKSLDAQGKSVSFSASIKSLQYLYVLARQLTGQKNVKEQSMRTFAPV